MCVWACVHLCVHAGLSWMLVYVLWKWGESYIRVWVLQVKALVCAFDPSVPSGSYSCMQNAIRRSPKQPCFEF